MAITYATALATLKDAARGVKASRSPSESQTRVSLEDAVGHVAACDCVSSVTTPEFDTSAMDGYALRSEATKHASPQHPVIFEVQQTIAAGDDPFLEEWDSGIEDDVEPCVEIMTGGRFPDSGAGEVLDACVRMEDVTIVTSAPRRKLSVGRKNRIAITKPVPVNANRRFAGADIQKGQLVLKAGQVIRSTNLMPLSSAGIKSVLIEKRPRMGVWSTGKELLSDTSGVPDVNGIFLTSAGREFGADAKFMGVLDDEPDTITRAIADALVVGQHPDVLVTSGGVSVGKFDFIRRALERMGATIVFHGLSIRPGHPVLFALVPSNKGKVAFFGLPGNPGAAAACFRFIVVPYLRQITEKGSESPMPAKLIDLEAEAANPARPRMGSPTVGVEGRDLFRPGLLLMGDGKENTVQELGRNQGPSKLWPFLLSNCWIHYKKDQEYREGYTVDCYPTSPTNAL
ncbi:hypothetical protein jhhlp_002513 [Lomentospora prolificans]|uniref:molybdopterin adenylyltransferase n=1 Tax=Lomentospora prolificans TaxID=41688 RepID=A0A2N3NE53_9PEZI|nr:hypothetical protein jhhlp_002513 [Lomentospora prolificans]